MFEKIVDFIREIYETPKGPVYLHEPIFFGKEKEYLSDCIDSTFVSSVGQYVDRFEEMVASYTDAKYAVSTVNGTSALHMAMLMAGVKESHLVITQPLTFVATCNAIKYIGADPLFVDVDRTTMGMSPESLEKFLNDHASANNNGECVHKSSGKVISACVPVHMYGHPAQIDLICQICEKHNIKVVEDAAESMGSTYLDRHTGTFGDIGIFSFNGNKPITCGGGGMIVTDSEELGTLGKHLTTQAKAKHPWDFYHDHIGYNYRLTNINAALGCAQMENLDRILMAKRELANQYEEFFQGTTIELVKEPTGAKSNYWFNTILLKDIDERDAFLKFTNNERVMTRPSWKLMIHLPMYENSIQANLDNSRWIEERLVCIPSSVPRKYLS